MGKDNFWREFPCSEFIEYIRSVISFYEAGNEDEYEDIKKDIRVLENRMNDENLYLGVIGSFSSGKSTFINSVIHKNLLTTDAVQGTTVAASILKRDDFEDLEITYLDGTSKYYSQCADELLSKYQMQSISDDLTEGEKISVWEKFINWIKRLFEKDISEKVRADERMRLFKTITATEDMAKDIQYVTLYYQNDNIPHRIALVDTPGIESLNERHSQITKNAIDNICDAIVVIIPYSEPVSESLLNYVNTYLEQQKRECIFVVTKIELLGDRDELPRLIRVIKKRLENGLGIETACVIPMPTFLYLKESDIEMQTTFLSDISESEKAELIQMYEEGLNTINAILNSKRLEYIKKKILHICERVSLKLSANLSEAVNTYDEKDRQLQSEAVKPLESFENRVRAEIKEVIDSYHQRVRGELGLIDIVFSDFRLEIEGIFNECKSSQELYHRMELDLYAIFDDINRLIIMQLSRAEEEINSKIRDLQKNFKKEYGRCGARCIISDIYINTEDIYLGEFISECETIFQERINLVKNSIRNDTSSFLKKFRGLFANPLERHKKLATTELSGALDEVKQKVLEYSMEQIEERIARLNIDAENAICNMLNGDRLIVEDYINRTNQSLYSNRKNKELTQVYIRQLDEYIKQMKEVV